MSHVNIKLDEDLDGALRQYMFDHGLCLSAAIRDLLRRALETVSSEHDAGWLEGYNTAFRAMQQAVVEAATRVKPALPNAFPFNFKRRP